METLRFAKLTTANQVEELTKRMIYLQGKITLYHSDPTKFMQKYFGYLQLLWKYTDTNFPLSQAGGGMSGGGDDDEKSTTFDKGPLLEFMEILEIK